MCISKNIRRKRGQKYICCAQLWTSFLSFLSSVYRKMSEYFAFCFSLPFQGLPERPISEEISPMKDERKIQSSMGENRANQFDLMYLIDMKKRKFFFLFFFSPSFMPIFLHRTSLAKVKCSLARLSTICFCVTTPTTLTTRERKQKKTTATII